MPMELPVSALASFTAGFAEPAAKLMAMGNTAGRLWSEKANGRQPQSRSCRSYRGRRTVNVEPLPSTLVTSMRP
jgi:hypothetical protein